MQAEWLPNEQQVLAKPEAVAAYRKAIVGTSIYRHAYDYVWVINWNMLLCVFVSLHEKVCLFQIRDVAVKALKKLQKIHVLASYRKSHSKSVNFCSVGKDTGLNLSIQ